MPSRSAAEDIVALGVEVPSGYHTNYILQRQSESSATPFATSGPVGISPAQIRRAYGFDQVTYGAGTVPADGAGTTIAIVSAFDNPNIENDLRQFSRQFGLPDPPLFTKVNQTGGNVMPATNNTWARETALDVQWAHAIAPKANILLVQATTNSLSNLNAAVAYAAQQPGVSVVSMSFGGGEFAGELGNDVIFVTPPGHQGVTFVAASGDFGAPPSQPAISPNVVAVGGTTLTLDAAGNIVSEAGWSGSGGGISAFQPQPGYQAGIVTQSTTMRTNPDVAYNANPLTGFAVYDTFNNSLAVPWSQVGGTSAAAPQWAALIAIANQGRALAGLGSLDGRTETLPKLYSLPAAHFHDTATGGSSGTPSYPAASGYDLVTGRGAPRADRIIAELVGLGVSSTVPAVGSVVSSVPATFTIHFSVAADPATVQANDLTVNGLAATGVTLSGGGKTATFTFANSPITLQGPQTMRIAPGAITGIGSAGAGFMEFSGKFFFDTSPLMVSSTNPPATGMFLLPGPLTYDVNFNEAIDPLSLQTSDLVVGGVNVLTVSAANNNMTARFTLSAFAEGTITANIAAGAISDLFGNPLATSFSAPYTLDNATTPLPIPVASKQPLGSLVYDTIAAGSISLGDTDTFTLPLDAGQAATILVTAHSPVFQPAVQFRDPANMVLATIEAIAPGKNAILQSAPIATSGVYTITVGGGSSTTGGYAVQVTLNGVLELEQNQGEPTNDTRVSAQDLTPFLTAPDSPSSLVRRVAVLGGNVAGSPAPATLFDFETGDNGFVVNNTPSAGSAPGLWHLSIGRGTQLNHSPTHSFYYGQGEGPNGGGTYQTGSERNKGSLTSPLFPVPPGGKLNFNYVLQTERVSFGDSATVLISTDGFATSTVVASNTTNMAERNSWGAAVPIDLTAYAGQSIQVRWIFDTVDEIFNNFEGWYIDDVQITLPSIWNDYYSISLGAGERLTAVLKSLSGSGANVILEDANGAVLATGAAGPTNIDRMITGFTAPTAGIYYLRATGNLAATYNLVATKNATFDAEANDTFAAAQNVSGFHGVLGAIAPGDASADWFAFEVASTAHAVRLESSTPADGVGQFINVFNPRLELFGPSNTLVASGTPLADVRNEFIEFQPTVTGTYRIRVASENGSTGEYFLSKSFAPIVTSLSSSSSINESEFATLSGTISDPDPLEPHKVVISWGPGEGTSEIELAPGLLTFSATHRYLDDHPTATNSDAYPISVVVLDNDGASSGAGTSVIVKNTAPSLAGLASTAVTENGTTTFAGTIADTGTLDTFTVVIDWGNGTQTLSNVPSGPFSYSRQYLDDNGSDSYPISIAVTDDDGGTISGGTTVTVNNVPPTATVTAPPSIDEGGTAVLSGLLNDPGSLDAFTLSIDWDDPLALNSVETINLANPPPHVTWNALTRNFTVAHRYLDDDQAGTANDRYTIGLTVGDDDAGASSTSVRLTVNNIAPAPTIASISNLKQEGTAITVQGVATDAGGIHDALTFAWRVFRSGLATPFASSDSAPSFVFTPDNEGTYRIELTVTDDDSGHSVIDQTITVENIAPVASDLEVDLKEDAASGVTLLATDVPGDSLTFLISVPLHGSLTGSAPNLTYTPAGNYHGPDSFSYRASDGPSTSTSAVVRITIQPVNDPPLAGDSNYSTAEDSPLGVVAGGVLAKAGDIDGDKLSASLVDDAAHGELVLSPDGSFTYTPDNNFNGSDSFTFRAADGQATSSLATILLNISSVNDAPSFVKGADQVATDETKIKTVIDWASQIKSGPPDEASQTVTFTVANDNVSLFDVPPTIDSTGTLTFVPKPNARGSAQVTVKLQDNGGPVQGGGEPITTQLFTINIEKPHPWHNVKVPFDVDGNNEVVPLDALLIINYLNSLPPSTPANVPLTAGVGKPFGYLDTNGENTVAPIDALIVINHLNAVAAAGEGEKSGRVEDVTAGAAMVSGSRTNTAWADLISLLAADVVQQGKRRRAGS